MNWKAWKRLIVKILLLPVVPSMALDASYVQGAGGYGGTAAPAPTIPGTTVPSSGAVSGGEAPVINPTTGLLTPGSSAEDNAAAVLAAEIQNWQDVYKPVELGLLQQSSLNNPSVLTDAVNQAGNNAYQTYNTMAGVQERQLAAQGIAATPQQQATMARVRSLSEAKAVAGAQNKARANVALNDQLIAVGSAPNPNVVQGSTTSTSTNNYALGG